MARLGDHPDPFVIKRVFSPDRRLALDYLPYPDPRTQYEVEAPESIALRDAETGAELARFGGWTFIDRYEWPEAGGVELALMRGVRLVVAPDLATFRPGGDEGAPDRPIGELPEWLRGITPQPRPLGPPPSRFGQAVTIAAVAALLALVVYGISRIPAVARLIDGTGGDAPARSATGGIDAWIVRCPGVGLAPMSLTPQGALRVPPAIAPAPLPPIDGTGRRFGDSGVAIEVDGADVLWWPRGPAGEAVQCPSTLREEVR